MSAANLNETSVAKLFDLSGQRALITGGSKGIGLGCAQLLADAGAEVIVVGRGAAEINDAVKSIQAKGGKAQGVACDVTKTEEVRKAFGGLDIHILVNNAGTNIPEPYVNVTEEHFDRIFDINVRAAFFVAQTVAARMLAQGIKGSIIHMSSQMGHVASPNRTVYCASKHAIEGLSKAMAVELAPKGIRVNTVAPTFIETPMTKPFLEKPEFRDFVLKKIALGKLGEIQDVAAAVLYLASPASAMITGSCIKVDGGWTAH
ncbi:MAG: SDR family oxidoreductase [Rhodospirillaceae bacterium]|nr:SDR family oxidoreductase [Rhodospirillaceae bacterium]